MKIDKKDLINMINGLEVGIHESVELEKSKLMYFSGDQWNPDWKWDTVVLGRMSEEDLENLYKKYRDC